MTIGSFDLALSVPIQVGVGSNVSRAPSTGGADPFAGLVDEAVVSQPLEENKYALAAVDLAVSFQIPVAVELSAEAGTLSPVTQPLPAGGFILPVDIQGSIDLPPDVATTPLQQPRQSQPQPQPQAVEGELVASPAMPFPVPVLDAGSEPGVIPENDAGPTVEGAVKHSAASVQIDFSSAQTVATPVVESGVIPADPMIPAQPTSSVPVTVPAATVGVSVQETDEPLVKANASAGLPASVAAEEQPVDPVDPVPQNAAPESGKIRIPVVSVQASISPEAFLPLEGDLPPSAVTAAGAANLVQQDADASKAPEALASPSSSTAPALPKAPDVDAAVPVEDVVEDASDPSRPRTEDKAETKESRGERQSEPAPAREAAQAARPLEKPFTPTSQHIMLPDSVAGARQSLTQPMPIVQSGTGSMPIVTAAVATEIAAQHRLGASRFDIRLDPPELGRIDVRLDVDRGGKVRSTLIVERADTLDMLRSDLRNLERALEQAGLRSDPNGVSLSLRDDRGASGQNGRSFQQEMPRIETTSPVEDVVSLATPHHPLSESGETGLDIRV